MPEHYIFQETEGTPLPYFSLNAIITYQSERRANVAKNGNEAKLSN